VGWASFRPTRRSGPHGQLVALLYATKFETSSRTMRLFCSCSQQGLSVPRDYVYSSGTFSITYTITVVKSNYGLTTTSGPRQQERDHMRLAPSQSSVYDDGISTQTQPYQAHARLSDEIETKAACTVDEHVPGQNPGVYDAEETRQMLRTDIRIPFCKACQTRLFDLLYECQDCPDTNFCSSCRLLQVGHVLQVVTGHCQRI
jgi:hypothetical protein